MNTKFRALAALVVLLVAHAAADAQFLGMPRYYYGPHAQPLVGPRSLRPLRYAAPVVQMVEVPARRSSVVVERMQAARASRDGAERVGDPLEDVAPIKLIDVSSKRGPQIAKALAEARTWADGSPQPAVAPGLRAAVREPVVLRVGKDPGRRARVKEDADVLPRRAVQWSPLPDGLREVYRDSNRAVLIVSADKTGKYTVYAAVLRAPSAEPAILPPLPDDKKDPKLAPKNGDAKPERLDKAPAKLAASLAAEEVIEFVPFVIEVGGADPATPTPTPVTPIPAKKADKTTPSDRDAALMAIKDALAEERDLPGMENFTLKIENLAKTSASVLSPVLRLSNILVSVEGSTKPLPKTTRAIREFVGIDYPSRELTPADQRRVAAEIVQLLP
jgi:hypothetical protein